MTLCTQQAAAAAVLVYLCSALLALQSLVSSRGEGEGEGECQFITYCRSNVRGVWFGRLVFVRRVRCDFPTGACVLQSTGHSRADETPPPTVPQRRWQ